jgi:hypothetical protein
LPVQIPAIDPNGRAQQEGVLSVSIPDIYPTRGQGLMDRSIEEGLGSLLPMYDRWFRLQHYWRLIHRRYPEAIRRKKLALVNAFASFLNTSLDTLKSDLQRIAFRLGPGWERRFEIRP